MLNKGEKGYNKLKEVRLRGVWVMNLKHKELIEQISKKYKVDSVGIFGSRARGDFSEDSDYDIFVIGELTLDDELELEALLEESLNTSVDLVKINRKSDRILLKNIFNDAIVIYSYNNSYENMYNWIENFFIENRDFIYIRKRDLIYD